jgi:hypothetical protein
LPGRTSNGRPLVAERRYSLLATGSVKVSPDSPQAA